MKILIGLLVLAMILLGINLFWTIGYLDSSPILSLSKGIIAQETDDIKDTWALRGQIGDIMSGHFSALAFLAVALSITFQYQANNQMKESIDKQEESLIEQSKALEIQSKSLEEQIGELKASRKESEKQTEQFFISNINIKLDRLYKLLDIEVENVLDSQDYIKLSNVVTKSMDKKTITSDEMVSINTTIFLAPTVYEILENIFMVILNLDKGSITYSLFYKEFSLKINNTHKLSSLCSISNKSKYRFLEAFDYECFNLANLNHKADL
jgi:hypothetical protein